MGALEIIIRLMEKVSVLLSAVMVLIMIRPAQVWLEETGDLASVRRRAFLVAVFSPLAIWGIFLGFEVGGQSFNTRSVGIIVSGYLGGVLVGTIVGSAAGVANALISDGALAPFIIGASVINGIVAALWARRFGTSLWSVTIGSILAQLVYHALLGGIYLIVEPEQGIQTATNVWLHAAKIMANTVGVVLFMGLLNLTRELDQARQEAIASRDQARSARLEALQYQLRPHFLFNLLNTLAYLIRTDPVKARELTIDLADFLRYSLSQERQHTSLREELEQISRYIELERARFGEGLRFVIEPYDDEVGEQLRVPPLILQPLVENAIKHGARHGEVEIVIQIELKSVHDEELVIIRVLDDGPGPVAQSPMEAEERRHQSVGLENVRERLDRFFHGHSALTLSARQDREGACAQLQVPLNPTPSGPRKLAQHARDRLRQAIASESEP